jgi:hypothetical protein
MSRKNIDPKTGFMERSVNIEDILEAKNIPMWGRPKGQDIFKRVSPLVDYVARQQSQ